MKSWKYCNYAFEINFGDHCDTIDEKTKKNYLKKCFKLMEVTNIFNLDIFLIYINTFSHRSFGVIF